MDWKAILDALERGDLRAASPTEAGDEWVVNTSVKEGLLAAFKAGHMVAYEGGFVDKVNLLPQRFSVARRVRVVPGGTAIRRGAYLAEGVIVMPPSYVNVGAYVDTGSMIDSHVLVGSCAQVGKRVHLSAGVLLGGVLEPVGARPVIVENDVFVGAGATLVEGMHIKTGAVIGPQVVLSASLPIYDIARGCIHPKGSPIPPYAVVVSGSRPHTTPWAQKQGLHYYAPTIIKYRTANQSASLALEEALR